MVAEMLIKKLRRGVKEPSPDDTTLAFRPRKDSAAVLPMDSASQHLTHPAADDAPPPSGLTFLDLPAELRNRVYEFVICDATLTLPTAAAHPSRRSKLSLRRRGGSKPTDTPLNGLLLTTRQLRHEYLSMLLSTAAVVVEVRDFDFAHVARVSAALAPADRRALQSNRRLALHLVTQNCTAKALAQLRRWLDFRRDHAAAALPWRYEVPLARLLPGTTMGRVRLLRELEYYADTIATLVVDLDAGQRAEMQRVIEAFEREAVWLEEDLGWLGQRSKSVSRSVRGLPGGGLH